MRPKQIVLAVQDRKQAILVADCLNIQQSL